MSSAPKSGGGCGEGVEMGIDPGKGKGKSEPEGGGSSGSAVGVTTTDMTEKLAQSFQDMMTLKGGGTKRMELISKLEASRTQAAAEERAARRAAWTEETRKVILERQLFQESGVIHFFPELVWERILKMLDDPKDKARLARMSVLWRDLSKMDRTTFLFDEIFALLHGAGLMGHLSRCLIILFRSVSREWRKSVDNWIQNFDDYPMQSYLQVHKLRPLNGYDKVPISFPVDVQRVGLFSFLSRYNYPPDGNPFFSRALEIGCVCPHDWGANTTFWIELERLLALWGREVWAVKLQFSSPNHFDCVAACEQIVRLLNLLPNLKHLVLLSPDPMDSEVDQDQLQTYMREDPLPEMPHLRSIVTSKVSPLMTKLMLEKFGPTLDSFIAYGVGGNLFENAQLPNLKVAMCLLPPEVAALTYMKGPSIKEISLHYDQALAEDIPNIFRNLGDVGGTLRKLNLILENEGCPPTKLDPASTKMLTLALPNLEELSLTMNMGRGNLKTMDFILPMTHLKILNLTYVKRTPRLNEIEKGERHLRRNAGASAAAKQKSGIADPAAPGGVVQFWEYTNRLYESNVWILFPELRKVTIITVLVEMLRGWGGVVGKDNLKEKVYSREGYKQYSNGH